MENNTVKFLWFFIFPFQAGANPLYQWTHDKMKDVFELEYRMILSLGKLYPLKHGIVLKWNIKFQDSFLYISNKISSFTADDIVLIVLLID